MSVNAHSDEGYGSPSDQHSRPGQITRHPSDEGVQIPQDHQLMLIEIFFSCFFHSSLVFHRSTLMQGVAEGTVPEHSLQAVFALASIYVESPLIRAKFGDAKLQELGDSKLLGIGCATRASSIVLKNIDTPALDSSRTCLLLGLYWFSRGDSNRNSMFLGIAARAARALCRETINTNPTKDWLHAELERRAFWASWVANCVNCDHYITGTSADSFVLSLPLPASDEAFEAGIAEPITTLSQISDVISVGSSRDNPTRDNVMAEMLRLVLHWAKIHDHIEARKHLPAKQSLVDLLDLDHWLSNWARTLPLNLKYSKHNLYQRIAIKKQTYYATMHCMFYQCRMVLHASVVPQFGGLSSSDGISPQTVRISAETALNSANAVAQVAEDLIAWEIDPSQFAAFVGYTCYVSATIHMSMLSSTNPMLTMTARKGLTATLNILKRMKPYWTNLERLWARVHILYEAQLARLPTSSKLASSALGTPSDDVDHEIDQIANTKRDIGRLTEPLSESVLQYSIDRLRKLIDVDESSFPARDLTNTMAGHVALDAGRDPTEISGSDILPSVSTSQREGNYGSILVGDFGSSSQSTHQTPMLPTETSISYDPYMIDGMDWSQFDMNSLLLPYGDVGDAPFNFGTDLPDMMDANLAAG